MNSEGHNTSRNHFAATELTQKKLRVQRMVGIGFGLMTVAILIPLIVIVFYIFLRARPVLGWKFITDIPRSGMRAGGLRLAGLVFFGIAVLGVLGMWLLFRRQAGPSWARQTTPHWIEERSRLSRRRKSQ